MKKYLLITLALPVLTFGQLHKGEFSSYLPITSPFKCDMPYMSTAAGMGFKFGYKPSYHLPFVFEYNTSWNYYSNKTLKQTFLFSDGAGTITDVSYSSGFNLNMFGVKTQIGSDSRKINGFITPQIGTMKMRSKIYVADPNDTDGCEALDRETTQKFRGAVYGGEVGVNLDLSLVAKNAQEGKHFFTLSGSYLSGFSKFEYVNVKYMQDHSHHLMSGGEILPVSEDGRTDINARFINVSTQDIHEHKIAELYNTNLRMWQINIGYTFRF